MECQWNRLNFFQSPARVDVTHTAIEPVLVVIRTGSFMVELFLGTIVFEVLLLFDRIETHFRCHFIFEFQCSSPLLEIVITSSDVAVIILSVSD